ncbi:hypothetical protein AAE478_004257 [Parahypoxylon ruwenzoriense]
MSEGSIYYAEPPPGQVRTPVNPPTRQGDLMAAGISMTIIAGIALGLRLYTRLHVLKNHLEADDCESKATQISSALISTMASRTTSGIFCRTLTILVNAW